MGQYHLPINLDRREFLHPHNFGDGLKLMEWCAGGDTILGLGVLLAASNGRGNGDLRTDPGIDGHGLLERHIVGRWTGQRVAIVGDYYENNDVYGLSKDEVAEIWRDEGEWTNISRMVLDAIRMDPYIREQRSEPLSPAPPVVLNSDGTISQLPSPVHAADEPAERA